MFLVSLNQSLYQLSVIKYRVNARDVPWHVANYCTWPTTSTPFRTVIDIRGHVKIYDTVTANRSLLLSPHCNTSPPVALHRLKHIISTYTLQSLTKFLWFHRSVILIIVQ